MIVIAAAFVVLILTACLAGSAVIGVWAWVTVRKMLKEGKK